MLIASALAVGGVSFAYSVLQNVEQESMTDVMTDSSSETQLDLTFSNFEIESVQEPSDSMVVSSVVLIAGLGVTVAQLVFSIFMIVVLGLAIDAAWNNYKPKFLIPWLIVLAIGISGSFIIFIDGISQEKSVGTIISYLFSAGINIKSWLIIEITLSFLCIYFQNIRFITHFQRWRSMFGSSSTVITRS